jgi:deoxyribonuclease IV
LIIGSHVSIKDGYLGAAKRAVANQASAFQYFPKNPRSLSVKDFDRMDANYCREFCSKHKLQSVAHTSYSTSLTPSKDREELTVSSILNDLEITEACGSIGVIIHFGSQISETNPLASYHLMLKMLNTVLAQWNGDSLILLENNAGTKGGLGTTLEEMIQIRNLCEHPDKIGFCFDTCHAFASGLWTGSNSEELFGKENALGYWDHLKVVHFNNSKYPSSSRKDRHANIFQNGYIQEEDFQSLVELLNQQVYILETPDDEGISHKEEIEAILLKWGNTTI